MNKTDFIEPDGVLIEPCEGPITISSGSARSVERNWKIDRKNLSICGLKFKTILEFYAARDKLIKGVEDSE